MVFYSNNSREKVYHLPHCSFVRVMNKENRKRFSSPEQARQVGYRLCNCCSPVGQRLRKERQAGKQWSMARKMFLPYTIVILKEEKVQTHPFQSTITSLCIGTLSLNTQTILLNTIIIECGIRISHIIVKPASLPRGQNAGRSSRKRKNELQNIKQFDRYMHCWIQYKTCREDR